LSLISSDFWFISSANPLSSSITQMKVVLALISLSAANGFRVVKRAEEEVQSEDGWPLWPVPAPPPPAGGGGIPSWGKGDTFWGIPLGKCNPGDSCVFVIDKSTSMSKTGQFGSKIRDEASQEELARCLGLLAYKWGYKFNVITYCASVSQAFPDPVLATPGNISIALALAAKDRCRGTNTGDALQAAYAMPTSPQKIYLMSDGRPSRGPKADDILPMAKSSDKGRGIGINSVLINGQDNAESNAVSFMRGLAQGTGGSFREVIF